MDISSIFNIIFSQESFQKAIASSVLIILLGYFLGKNGVFQKVISQSLSTVLLSVALPMLAFTSFMVEINTESLKQGLSLLIWGFAMYILLILLTKFLYFRSQDDAKVALIVCTIFGSTTFFGIPIVNAMYGATGVIYANVFNISYRVFLYSYALVKMSGVPFEKKSLKEIFFNPIILATFAGLLIWIFQGYLPTVMVKEDAVPILRIDQTMPWLFSAMKSLAMLTSPLAWLAIGNTLSTLDLKQASSSGQVWYYCLNKVILIPALNLIILFLLTVTKIFSFSFTAIAVVIVMMATPTATVAAAYAIKYDKAAVLSANCSLLSTVASVVIIPIWLILLQVLYNLSIFL